MFYTNFRYLKLVLINKLEETKFFVGNIFNLTLLNAKFLALKTTMAASPFFIYLAGVFFFRISCTGGKLRSNQPLVVLRDLLLLLQFKKKHEKLLWRNVPFSKVAGLTLLHGCFFLRFLN